MGERYREVICRKDELSGSGLDLDGLGFVTPVIDLIGYLPVVIDSQILVPT